MFAQDAPEAAAGAEVEDATAFLTLPGGQHLWHRANVILAAKQELEHAVLELRALGGGHEGVMGEREGAHVDLLLVSGEHVSGTEGVEASPVYLREVDGVVVADKGDLVERKDDGVF